MDCNICYDTFKEFELISGGCCSCKVCRRCISDLAECPQCRHKYFWINHNQVKYYKNVINGLNNHVNIQQIDILRLVEQKKEKQTFIDNLILEIRGKDKKINLLMDKIDDLHKEKDNILEEIDYNEYNKIQLEDVIQRYNLNIS